MPGSDRHERLDSSSRYLDSWKEISLYLRREVRTVQRWEKSEALPIHRHFHNKLGSVYAYTDEIDRWMSGRKRFQGEESDTPENPPQVSDFPLSRRSRRHIVGREAEQAQLQRAYSRALRGQGVLIGITGEAGLGKTAFVEDFLSTVESENLWIGSGSSYNRLAGTEAYLPVLEALECLLQTDSEQFVMDAMKTIAPRWYGAIVPHPTSPAVRPDTGFVTSLMHQELGHLLQKLSRKRPVVLFFDDLHWSDLSTMDLVSYLGSRLASLPILLIVCYRPEELASNENGLLRTKLNLRARGLWDEIPLPSLTRLEVSECLALESGGTAFAHNVIDLIYSQTEGNPMFVVDLFRYLRDKQLIELCDSVWVKSEGLTRTPTDLPNSILSLIQRKIDRLDDMQRTVLQVASLQGTQFNSAVVSGVLGTDSGGVEQQLELLARNHLLIAFQRENELRDGSLTLQYRFVHTLYQNVLRDSVKGARAVNWSKKAAEIIRRQYGDGYSAVGANLAVLHETAREFEQAVDCYTLAAQEAVGIFANHEAIALAKRAVHLLKRLEDSEARRERELKIQLILRVPLTATNGYGSQGLEEVFESVRRLSTNAPEGAKQVPIIFGEFLYHTTRANLNEALECARELEHEGTARKDPDILSHAHHALLSVFTHRGELEKAWPHFEAGMRYYRLERSGFHVSVYGRDPAVGLYCVGALASWASGYPDRAIRMTEQAIVLARSIQHPHSLALAQLFNSWIYYCRGEPDNCVNANREVETLCKANDFTTLMGWSVIPRAFVQHCAGEHEKSIQTLENGLEQLWDSGLQLHLPVAFELLATILLRTGQFERALKAAEQAIAATKQTGQLFCLSGVLRVNGEIHCEMSSSTRQPHFALAEGALLDSMSVAHSQGARSFELRSAISLCRLYRLAGETRDLDRLRRLYNRFSEGYSTPDLTLARKALAAGAGRQS
jgi:tetratricopeptide (TPR) repeat protein